MGSQIDRFAERCTRLFNVIAELVADKKMSEFHWVINAGKYADSLSTHPFDNVTVFKWAPQVEVLQLSAIAIIHGGLGTVKECIYHGVPMIVLPDGYDQPANAARIV